MALRLALAAPTLVYHSRRLKRDYLLDAIEGVHEVSTLKIGRGSTLPWTIDYNRHQEH